MLKRKILIIAVAWTMSVILISSILAYYQNYKTLSNLGDILAFAAGTFLGLSDTPSSYSGQAGKVVRVNSGEDALEFGDRGGLVIGNGDIEWVDAGTVYYLRPFMNGAKSDETHARYKVPISGTVRWLRSHIYNNSLDGNFVMTVRKNGVDQSLSITVPAGATGEFEDTTNSFSVNTGDYISIKTDATAATTGNIRGQTTHIYIE